MHKKPEYSKDRNKMLSKNEIRLLENVILLLSRCLEIVLEGQRQTCITHKKVST